MNDKNNHKHFQKQATKKNYTHIFISSKIALSKKFKKNIFNNLEFTDRLCLLAVNEVYLVEQLGKAFYLLYAKIKKFYKRIPYDIPLLGISATLTKQA